ncbi:hypothetical protein [Azospirillum soli]|uniref:hypothetical protein n=1 Tax=Azospirillum soli TaxID=1304799 RepID=UPI001AE41E26|nr:hypothetical protein [Azospirillum soli]MBP2311812.1 hypothetical protein [Azospirillum soli]
MHTTHRLMLAAAGVAMLAFSGTAFARAQIDTKDKPDLPACTPEVIKTSDCHIHDSATHMRMSKEPPSTRTPHAHLEYEAWMRDQHRR